MEAHLELFVLTWGLYPRRILLYLSEKGLTSSPLIKITPVSVTSAGIDAAGKPPGSVPILRLPDGSLIKQSAAILEYFEDICDNPDPQQNWQVELAASATNKTSMRGDTPKERAQTREIMGLADEASTQFVFACHKGTALFVQLESTNALAAKLALEYCKKSLRLIEENYLGDSQFGDGSRFTIAHHMLYSLLQFSRELYDVDLLTDPGLPNLQRLFDIFKKRDPAKNHEDHFPQDIRKLAIQWLPIG